MKKYISILMIFLLLLGVLSGCGGTAPSPASSGAAGSSAGPSADSSKTDASAADSQKDAEASLKDLVILYTNDVHCGVDDNLGYAGLSAYRKELEADGKTVLLVDAGDSIQGADIGMMTNGEAIIRLMNALKYDVATLGNHEFEYSVEKLIENTKNADFPYVCCNFRDAKSGKLIFEPYTILEACGKKLAFVGVVTPKTITTSMPTYFKDEDGEYRYDFCGGEEGKKLYEAVQQAVDDARAEGAELCILLSHLGVDDADVPYNVLNVIANTNGIDVVLDGHSHSVLPSEEINNKDGEKVLYSQTGTKLANIGKLSFDDNGKMSCELVSETENTDETITELIQKLRSGYQEMLNEHVGHTKYDLAISDEDGNRIVRNVETNLADLVADAFRYAADSEVSVIVGGNVRVDLKAGELTMGDIYAVLPFGNNIVLIEATGQQLADALEFGARAEPEECGGFMQVSGIEYTLDMSVPSGVKTDENDQMIGIEGERRVKDIRINGEPLDSERVYTVGGTAFTLLFGGDGYTSFNGCEQISIDSMLDAEALSSYIRDICGGEIPEQYANRYGEGRIKLIGE